MGGPGSSIWVLWIAYSSNDDDNSDEYSSFNDIRFYDEWSKIICMWCVTANVQNWTIWRWFYYLEINKTTLVITRSATYNIVDSTFSFNDTGTYMSIQNISWTNRYCFVCDNSRSPTWYWKSVYYNWTSLVEWWTTWSSIWSTTISLAWKTLSWSVENYHVIWSLNCYMVAMWKLNFS